jgi:hypothetical protein
MLLRESNDLHRDARSAPPLAGINHSLTSITDAPLAANWHAAIVTISRVNPGEVLTLVVKS